MFKVGDKVICVDDRNRTHEGLIKDKMYIITHSERNFVRINDNILEYVTERFRSVKSGYCRKLKLKKIVC